MSVIKRKLDEYGAWLYDDPSEHSFVIAALLAYGIDISEFDDFLKSIEDTPRGKELVEWRFKALQAENDKNYLAAEGWLNAINASWHQAKSSNFLLPLAKAGNKQKQDSRKGIEEKLKRDPKQAAKKEIFELWKQWRKVRGVGRWRAAFARSMLDKFPVLENQKTIENWAIQWEKVASK